MSISNKQKAAMAAIITAGLLSAGAILWRDDGAGASADSHGEEAAHGHAEEKEHSHGDEKGHAEEKGRGEESGHAGDKQEAGTLKLTPEQLQAAGIRIATAGPAVLQGSQSFPGEIRLDEDRTAHVVPVVAGVAQAVPVQLGETVKKGQLLAVIASAGLSQQRSELLAAQQRRALAAQNYEREKKLWEERISAQQDYLAAQAALREADIAVGNASQRLQAVGASANAGGNGGLNRFELRAPQDGVVIEKHLSLGEAVKEDTTVFTLSDLRSVWAEFNVSAQDLGRVQTGRKAIVTSSAFDEKAPGEVAYVGALLGEQSRTAKARVRLENPRMAWRPGLFVSVTLAQEPVPSAIAVPVDAVQAQGEQSVVYLALPGNEFKTQVVKLGRSDGRNVEVLDGLAPGAQLASGNTFVIKSELGKSSAAHTH
ncbi:MAG: efflux RND transporter periplasmic adaptor subunit [Proteobacteria bacterium]|nr:efflux RND transporter periplasmic adaptor subunit [Pseudomonadota bacterium]